MTTIPRGRRLLRRPGALGLPVSSGEAINRFDDDVGETCDFPLWLPEVAGQVHDPRHQLDEQS